MIKRQERDIHKRFIIINNEIVEELPVSGSPKKIEKLKRCTEVRSNIDIDNIEENKYWNTTYNFPTEVERHIIEVL